MRSVEEWVANPETLETPEGLDVKDHQGITPLAYAVGANRLDVAKMLIEKKADPNNCDNKGRNAMHYAAGYGRKENIDYLKKQGVKVDKADNDGKTPADV